MNSSLTPSRLLTLLFLLLATSPIALSGAPLPASFQRGACIEGGPELSDCNISDLAACGVTHVSLNPFGWMGAPDSPEVGFSTHRNSNSRGRWWGESDEGLKQYAAKAHEHGMQVMLRPHIWLTNTTDRSGKEDLWLGDVDFPSEEEWAQWFEGYSLFALHYARIAEEAQIEWYSIGAELTRSTVDHPKEWRALIARIRTIYHGKLLYSANWWEEVENITFWDDLDAIGVQAYYPLTEKENPTTEELQAAWEPRLEMLTALAQKFDRPVILTEIGYKSTSDAVARPWEWQGNGTTDPELQARAYQATFEAISKYAAISGTYWWKYHADDCAGLTPGKPLSPRRARAFSWQKKPAAQILKKYYGFAGE